MKHFKNLYKKFLSSNKTRYMQTYFYDVCMPNWMSRNYEEFASEAYIKNVIAHRAIAMTVQAAASVDLKLYINNNGSSNMPKKHKLLELLKSPNPMQSGKEFLECLYAHRLIAGNAYITLCYGANNSQELYLLRPDRVTVEGGDSMIPLSYVYKVGTETIEFEVDQNNGSSLVLHIKNFHPLSDWYGLSSIEAAAYSIDQHNQAGEWNQSLLRNGARPSGAIVVNNQDGRGYLTDRQFNDLKSTIDDMFSGARNAGRPILLEGGLDWKEMSLSPRDMDFIESKHSSARDIALALGMPPQLLGIPGDNTYSNLQEARLAFWEQTVIPLVEHVSEKLSVWFSQIYNQDVSICADLDSVPALAGRREAVWDRVNNSNFLTINEKRAMVGLSPIRDGDIIDTQPAYKSKQSAQEK